MQENGGPEQCVKGKGGNILRHYDLAAGDGSRHEGFEGTCFFLFGKKPHGQERENEEKIEPEIRCAKRQEEKVFTHRGVLHFLHRGGHGQTLHERDKAQYDPSKRGKEIVFEFLAEEYEKNTHEW